MPNLSPQRRATSAVAEPGKSASVVDGLRAAILAQPHAPTMTKWLGLATGEIGFPEFARIEIGQNKLDCLTIDTTGACDLTCEGVCYYNPAIDIKEAPVSEQALRSAILDAKRELELRVLVLGGKEPLLNPVRAFSILRFAAEPVPGPGSIGFSAGIITNGRQIHRHWGELEQAVQNKQLQFLDVSIDSGYAEEHDRARGREGTFKLAHAAVLEATARLAPARIAIASILKPDNIDGLLELLRISAPSVRHFYVTPLLPPTFSQTSGVGPDTIKRFLDAVASLFSTELAGMDLELTFYLGGLYLLELNRSGLFAWDELRETEDGYCYVRHDINKNQVAFQIQVLPEYGSRLGRILPNGTYLAHAHFLQAPNPGKYAVGSIVTERLPQLYERAKTTLFQDIAVSRAAHECRKRPCWTNCFGGWTLAENSILRGIPLQCRPAECVKTEQDFALLEDGIRC